eukprot:4494598-Lingulodinium_polyedra.AAC.1
MEGHVDAVGGSAVLLQDPGMPHKERLGGGHAKAGDHPNLVEQREAVEDAQAVPDRVQEGPPGSLVSADILAVGSVVGVEDEVEQAEELGQGILTEDHQGSVEGVLALAPQLCQLLLLFLRRPL